MIFVGLDDTDIVDSPGTNKLARRIRDRLYPDFRCRLIVRHQLLFDPRIPYTSKNSSASMWFDEPPSRCGDLIDAMRAQMRMEFVEGSDPGFCVTATVPIEVVQFGFHCKSEVTHQNVAMALAHRQGLHLEAIGGTRDGVIGALAAVGLAYSGNDGRVVGLGNHPDDLCGVQQTRTLYDTGVQEIRCSQTAELLEVEAVDIGKHLRPSLRDGKVVQFVEQVLVDSSLQWQAVRLT